MSVTEPRKADHPFNPIEEGMDVYAAGGHKIGTVDDVFFGEVADDAIDHGGEAADSPAIDLSGDDTVMENLTDVFGGDDLPRELAERLLNSGYLHVDGGLLGPDYFAMPDQVEAVTEEGVQLNVAEDGLIKR